MSKAFISEVDRSIDYMSYPTMNNITPDSPSTITIASSSPPKTKVRLSDIHVEEGIGLPVGMAKQLPKVLLIEAIKNQFGAQAEALIEKLADVKFTTVEDPATYVPDVGCCITFDLGDGFTFSVLRKIRLTDWVMGEREDLATWMGVTTFTANDKLKILAGVLGE